MLRELVLDNPLFVKQCRARLRRQHFVPLIALTIVTCTVIAWTAAAYASEDRELARGYFIFLLVGQAGLLLFLATARVASAVAEARDSGMLDFHRISPQRPLTLGIGFVSGSPIREWALFACTVPFSFLLAALAGMDLLAWLALMIVLVATALFYHLVGVVAALSVPELRGGAAGIGFLVVFLHMAAFPMTVGTGIPLAHLTIIPTAVAAIDSTLAKEVLPPGLPQHALSALLLALVFQVPLACFAVIAMVRKMRDQVANAYSKPIAVLFYFVVAALCVLGSAIAPHPQYPWELSPFSSWATYALLGVGILLTLAVTPDRSQFARGIRQARKAGLPEAPPWSDAAVNWSVVPLFALALVPASIAAEAVAPGARGVGLNAFAAAAVAAFSLLFFGYAKQSLDLAYGKLSRTYLGGLVFALWLLPLLIGMLVGIASGFETQVEPIFAASPIAGVYLAFSEPIRDHLPPATAVALIASVVPAIGFALLSPGQMRRARQELEQGC